MSKIPALTVRQWLQPEWDQVMFQPVPPREKPEPTFYLFSMSAYDLKRLTGVYRRDPDKPPAEDLNVQRRHDPQRSREILRYIQDGFPLSRIDRKKLVDQSEVRTLRMPGWLPTAVIVNILTGSDKRGPKNSKVAPADLIEVNNSGNSAEILLPKGLKDKDWQPKIHPIEVIDGQHRLWALDDPGDESQDNLWTDEFREKVGEMQIPVVAFHGLDATWRAYLFYTINQLPKKIDTSMVFDLYPLLRTQEWLLRFEGPNIYRQTRAQDLTIILWSHPESPWKDRIIRLGGRERGKVTQASFISSLMASFIKSYRTGGRMRLGGLFGSTKGTHETQLPWVREQQAAFLIMVWQEMERAVTASREDWATAVLKSTPQRQLLFSGPETLLGTDQGVRGFLTVLNDIMWLAYDSGDLDLDSWNWEKEHNQDDEEAISDALESIRQELKKAVSFARQTALALAHFDWRVSSVIRPTESQFSKAASYRGSGGYRLIRQDLLFCVRDNGSQPISDYASQVIELLNIEVEEEI